jgi:hypothetical protein
MFSNDFDKYDNFKGMMVPIPTNFKSLPPLTRLNHEQLVKAFDLEKTYIKESGIKPGTYTTFSEVKLLIQVHDRLWDTLESELSKFENLTICKLMYQRLEVIWGHIHKNKYDTSVEQKLTGRTQGARKRAEFWRAITPISEGIKFILEIAPKCCVDSGFTSGSSRIDFLIGLASRVFYLDQHLDSIYNQILPYRITINQDFSLVGGIVEKSLAAIDSFMQTEQTHTIQADKDFIGDLHQSLEKPVKNEDFLSIPGFTQLDKAFIEELGYGLFDWLNYVKGCMSLFGEPEFLKVIGIPKLKRHLKKEVGLSFDKAELIFKDHMLSRETTSNMSREQLMPVSNYKRDSRLLRRPTLKIDYRHAEIAILGIETFTSGIQVFMDSLSYGTLQIPRMNSNGSIKKTMGILASDIGKPFRDSIASRCISIGFTTKTEWALPQKETTQKPVGPIDVLVIDQKNKRFILIEAKNLQSQGLIPKEMRNQRERFLGKDENDDDAFLSILKNKENAFIQNKEWHIKELKMDKSSDFSVESLIVVFHPIFWPLFASRPLPILDDLEFYHRLERGNHFFTEPVSL